MKLWYSTTSPYVRKVLVTLKYQQLLDKTELIKIGSSFDASSPHNQANPLGRVPALERNCGNWLYGSLLICEYLDQKGKVEPKLIPESGKPRWAALALHNLADGIMENTVPMMAEKMLRPESEWWTARHQQLTERNRQSFARLEQDLKPFGTELNIGTLTAVAVIDWFLFRAERIGLDLAKEFPNLTAWAAEMNEKYEVLSETMPTL